MTTYPSADFGATMFYVLAVLALAYVFCSLLDREQKTDRWLFSAIGAALVADYFIWRALETLPSPALTVAAAWQWGFFACEAIPLLGTMISFLLLSRTSDHRHLADRGEAQLRERWKVAKDQLPAVDVFICTYNEELQILEKTILAALAIDYPNHTVYVLDDRRRGWLREYCEKVGARYVTRPDNVGAKAGNIGNGIRQSATLTNAPFILVLDADFAADKRILLRVLGLFDDEKVGIVQTPQFYYNADPIQHNLLGTRSWVDEQRLFFDIIEPAKDAWGVAFCVGTSFVVRRELLDRLGGYPQDSVAEDLYLSYCLMKLGYVTRWLNEKLSVGLSAEGLGEYVTQRSRWCLGAIQVACLKDGPVLGAGYTFTQRLHFWHGLLHWFGRPFVILMLLAPVVYWLFGLPAINTDHVAFLQHGVPALIASWAFGYWRFGRRVLPLLTEVSQMIAAVPVTLTIASALRNPFGKPFKVTPKGGDRSSVTVHWGYVCLFAGIIGLTMFGIIKARLDAYVPATSDPGFLFNFFWSIVSMVLCFVAVLVSIDLPRRRAEERFAFSEPTLLASDAGQLACVLEQLAVDGATVRLPSPHDPENAIQSSGLKLDIDGVGWIDADVLRVRGREIEVGFRHDDITRPALIRRLFTIAPVSTALVPLPLQAWKGVLRRAFASPRTFDPA